ncbi:decarboxylating NADP(+)-dependent phosphogluconate dehydrogenase [Sulfurimonas sp.]|nr:decarboxylating NADP(+)-dependent phosphogluconate dehydrogenase [Sulfurimonas sp.]
MLKSDIGIFGLGVMGQNLALNLANNGYKVSVYNRTEDGEEKIIEDFMGTITDKQKISGFTSVEDFVESLKSKKIILIMVVAGKVVDSVIEKLLPLLDNQDILIDGGNSNYLDTAKRLNHLKNYNIDYLGCGISGGSEGALKGPSMMPGGSQRAWKYLEKMFQDISAKDINNKSCCQWMGVDGAGHFVKMVHNGIEYAIMQVIVESYDLQKRLLRLNNNEIEENMSSWKNLELNSFLLNITCDLLLMEDEHGDNIVDTILDKSSQKGTGKDTVINSLKYGIPSSLISEAVNARFISSFFKNRQELSEIYNSEIEFKGKKELLLSDLYDAMYFSILLAYIQGFMLIEEFSKLNKWDIDLVNVIGSWKAGCIIQSDMLYTLEEALKDNLKESLFENNIFSKLFNSKETGLRNCVSTAILSGIPAPVLTASVSFFDSIRSEKLPANLIQAQRDFFGYHGFEKVGGQKGEVFHLS